MIGDQESSLQVLRGGTSVDNSLLQKHLLEPIATALATGELCSAEVK
jgi:hypothetical protein